MILFIGFILGRKLSFWALPLIGVIVVLLLMMLGFVESLGGLALVLEMTDVS